MFSQPTYKTENRLYKIGYQNIAGLDEAGRGAWAGPVVAAAVVLPPKFKINGLNDSKLLSPAKREELYVIIIKNAVAYSTGIISEKTVDTEGIISATRQAFFKAIKAIENMTDYLLIDGIKIFDHKMPYEFFIKGDNRIASIAAASIVAKVTRDHLLNNYHRQYPVYGFDRHKGYGTAEHRKMIYTHGFCPLHRLSFQPLIDYNHFVDEKY